MIKAINYLCCLNNVNVIYSCLFFMENNFIRLMATYHVSEVMLISPSTDTMSSMEKVSCFECLVILSFFIISWDFYNGIDWLTK